MEAIQRNGSPTRKSATMGENDRFSGAVRRARFRLASCGVRFAVLSGPSSGGGARFRSGTLVGRIMPDLVIVESPGKTRKINQILGSGYVVRASLGHVRDLPQPKRDGRSSADRVACDPSIMPPPCWHPRAGGRACAPCARRRTSAAGSRSPLRAILRRSPPSRRPDATSDPLFRLARSAFVASS